MLLEEKLGALIRSGRLLPGERVDQRTISELLQVSRTPLREALRALAADGVLQHAPNQGYTVTKFSADEMLQLYDIRGFIEGQLLRTVVWPSSAGLAQLQQIHEQCIEAAANGSTETLSKANQAFHFEIFSYSPLKLLFQENERIWRVSSAYRALQMSSAETRAQIGPTHARIVETVRAEDHEALVAEMAHHRDTTRQRFEHMLTYGGSMPI